MKTDARIAELQARIEAEKLRAQLSNNDPEYQWGCVERISHYADQLKELAENSDD